MPDPVNMFKAFSARQMVPMTNQPRRFTAAQVVPFCEHLVKVMNKMLPARFTLVKESDSALTIHVSIGQPALKTGTTRTGTTDNANVVDSDGRPPA